jgi:protoporphyrinogen oxidase
MGRKALGGKRDEGDSFASVLLANLGPTICRDFYFPYARKIWGREPDTLSGIQARRRVSAGSFGKLVRKVLSQVPGLKPPGAGRFFYPKKGYGQISEAFAAAAQKNGADFRLGSRVAKLHGPSSAQAPWIIELDRNGKTTEVTADYVWSTIPITVLARSLSGRVPAEVRDASAAIEYRAMILVYLELPVDQFTEFDAHYFPSADVSITRLSEPKNYAVVAEPRGRTTLCAELPCEVDDEVWRMDDSGLGRQVADDLARAGIPLPAPPVAVHTRRLRQAYPIYTRGYEGPFGILDHWAESLPRLLTYGRQGLFAHDNTHHALYMARAAVDCLEPAGFNEDKWTEYRKVFATHVVED